MKQLIVFGLVVAGLSHASDTRMRYQTSFSSGDRFAVLNGAERGTGYEKKGMGLRVDSEGNIKIGNLFYYGAASAAPGTNWTADSASDMNNRANATVIGGGYVGGPRTVFTPTVNEGNCDVFIDNYEGSLQPADGVENTSTGWYCTTYLASCEPTSGYQYSESGDWAHPSDGSVVCARATAYSFTDYYSQSSPWTLTGDPEVQCYHCIAPYLSKSK